MAQLDFVVTVTNIYSGESRDIFMRKNVCFATLAERAMRGRGINMTEAEYFSSLTYRVQGDLELAEKVARELKLKFTTVPYPDPEYVGRHGLRIEVGDMIRVKAMYSLFMIRNMDIRWNDGVSAPWKDAYQRGLITTREFCALSNCFEPGYHAFQGLNYMRVHSTYNSLLPSGIAHVSDFKRMCIDLNDLKAKRLDQTFKFSRNGYESTAPGVDATGHYITGSFCSARPFNENDREMHVLVNDAFSDNGFTTDALAGLINSLLGRSVFTGKMLTDNAKKFMKGEK